jgi:hypothetical protein
MKRHLFLSALLQRLVIAALALGVAGLGDWGPEAASGQPPIPPNRFLDNVTVGGAPAPAGTAVVPALLAAHGASVRAEAVASITLPPPGSTVDLFAGCNNISLTFPDGTGSETVVAAVTPVEAVESMWLYSAAEGEWYGYSPEFPEQSTLEEVDFLDAVWICVEGAGGYAQPLMPPNRFFGDVTLDGAPAPAGTTVDFTVAGSPAGSATWRSGAFTELDLAATAGVPALLAAHGSSVEAEAVAMIELPAPGGTVGLFAGCNNISLTFPDGTGSETVVGAVNPVEAVLSMWLYSAAEGEWYGYSPEFPDQSTLEEVDFLDAVWICVEGAGGYAQPLMPPNRFFGDVTLDGAPAPAGTNVTASICGTVCGEATVQADSTYILDVASMCGTNGGPAIPPNRFLGNAAVGGAPAPPGTNVTATIGSAVCGEATVQADSSYVLDVVSASGETPCCGIEGAWVDFWVEDLIGGTATWHSGWFSPFDLATGVCLEGIGNGSSIPGDDGTNPAPGNDCDRDGLADFNEATPDDDGHYACYDKCMAGGNDPVTCAAIDKATDRGPDITYDDDNDGNPCCLSCPGCPDADDDPPAWDSDGDAVRDGAECALGTDPTNPADRPTVAQCGGSGDTDTDGLLDVWETCKWGTDPSVIDSDSDGTGDCKEAADVDGNGVLDFVSDVISYAKAALLPAGCGAGQYGKDGDFDLNKDGVVDFVGDAIQEAKFALITGLCK